jgi:hypothetical protein
MLLTLIPAIPVATKMLLTFDTLGLHNVIADILKLIETPTCTSKQRSSGSITGVSPHAG